MALSISGSSPSFSSYQGGTITSGTAQASTSGTSIDFTGIPSWVKRVTVMFNNTSTNGSSNLLVQIGSGSIVSTGYVSGSSSVINAETSFTTTAGFGLANNNGSSASINGAMTIRLFSGNTYTEDICVSTSNNVTVGGGSVTLSGVLDRVRITTVNGTDTFDAGSINILYE